MTSNQVNDRSIYNHADDWMSNHFIPKYKRPKLEKSLDKNETFKLFIKRSINIKSTEQSRQGLPGTKDSNASLT